MEIIDNNLKFKSYTIRVVKDATCDHCGVTMKKRQTLTKSYNPWDVKPDGKMKTKQDILAEMRETAKNMKTPVFGTCENGHKKIKYERKTYCKNPNNIGNYHAKFALVFNKQVVVSTYKTLENAKKDFLREYTSVEAEEYDIHEVIDGALGKKIINCVLVFKEAELKGIKVEKGTNGHRKREKK